LPIGGSLSQQHLAPDWDSGKFRRNLRALDLETLGAPLRPLWVDAVEKGAILSVWGLKWAPR
jgi:hypothetical protein